MNYCVDIKPIYNPNFDRLYMIYSMKDISNGCDLNLASIDEMIHMGFSEAKVFKCIERQAKIDELARTYKTFSKVLMRYNIDIDRRITLQALRKINIEEMFLRLHEANYLIRKRVIGI